MWKNSFLFLSLIVCLISCGKDYKISNESVPGKIPVLIVVKQIITGPFFNHKIKQPIGITVDNEGNIYIADAGNNRIIKLDSLFNPIGEIGGQGRQAGLLDLPVYVSLDNNLNLVISEEGNRRLSRFDAKLNFIDNVHFYDFENPNDYGYPSGICMNSYGEYWVVDKEKNRIVWLDRFGAFKQYVGQFGASGGQLLSPEKIIRFKDKYLVCDSGNKRVMIYDEYGDYLRSILHAEFKYPISIFIDDDNWLWTLDASANRVIVTDLNGDEILMTGLNLPGLDDSMEEPSDICRLKNGDLLISDSGNDRILICQVFTN